MLFLGEHIKNWRQRYFVLLDDGSLLGFKHKPEPGIGLAEPLNNFTVKGCQIMKAVNLTFCFCQDFLFTISSSTLGPPQTIHFSYSWSSVDNCN
jgi:hypothetical protein